MNELAASSSDMNPSEAAREMLGTGRRGLAGVIAGAVWVAWGLIVSHNFAGLPFIVFLALASSLLIACGYCIVKGRSLQKKYPFARLPVNRGFLVVTVLEAGGVGIVIAAAQKWGRLDLLPDWMGIVIGLHFFGLAKALRKRSYYVTGTAVTLWCVAAWILFRGDTLAIAVGIGVGAILWATSSFNLARAIWCTRWEVA